MCPSVVLLWGYDETVVLSLGLRFFYFLKNLQLKNVLFVPARAANYVSADNFASVFSYFS